MLPASSKTCLVFLADDWRVNYFATRWEKTSRRLLSRQTRNSFYSFRSRLFAKARLRAIDDAANVQTPRPRSTLLNQQLALNVKRESVSWVDVRPRNASQARIARRGSRPTNYTSILFTPQLRPLAIIYSGAQRYLNI